MTTPVYTTTDIDKRRPPQAFFEEERYVGYRAVDYAKPYARYFRSEPLPMQAHVVAALRAGPTSPSNVVPVANIAREMAQRERLALETGFGLGSDGTACVACLTEMPNVEPIMWQWWFGWHLAESARYKLWHPTAHVFTAPGRPVPDTSVTANAQPYVGNVSYIDEYIGPRLMRLAVRFVSPSLLGFADPSSDCVTIVARGGPSLAPVSAVWLIHQVRRTSTGAELRSRFFIGPPVPLIGVEPWRNAGSDAVQAEPSPIDLLEHCGTEMNHLASFLPDLYHEFGE